MNQQFYKNLALWVVILVVMLFFTGLLAGMDYFLNALMTGVVF